jgi:cell division protein FtsB
MDRPQRGRGRPPVRHVRQRSRSLTRIEAPTVEHRMSRVEDRRVSNTPHTAHASSSSSAATSRKGKPTSLGRCGVRGRRAPEETASSNEPVDVLLLTENEKFISFVKDKGTVTRHSTESESGTSTSESSSTEVKPAMTTWDVSAVHFTIAPSSDERMYSKWISGSRVVVGDPHLIANLFEGRDVPPMCLKETTLFYSLDCSTTPLIAAYEKISEHLARREKIRSSRKQEEATKLETIQTKRNVLKKNLQAVESKIEDIRKKISVGKKHLEELRTAGSPPARVKLLLEAVVFLLAYAHVDVCNMISAELRLPCMSCPSRAGNASSSLKQWPWTDMLRKITATDRFLDWMMNFDISLFKSERSAKECVSLLRKEYFEALPEDFNRVAMTRANRVCGPVFDWLQAQLEFIETAYAEYGSLMSEIADLQKEIDESEKEEAELEKQFQGLWDIGKSMIVCKMPLRGSGPGEYVLQQILSTEYSSDAWKRLQVSREWNPSSRSSRSFPRPPRPMRDIQITIIGEQSETGKSIREFLSQVCTEMRITVVGVRHAHTDGKELLKAALSQSDYVISVCGYGSSSFELLSDDFLSIVQVLREDTKKFSSPKPTLIMIGDGEILGTPLHSTCKRCLESGFFGRIVIDHKGLHDMQSDDPLWTVQGIVLTPQLASSSQRDTEERYTDHLKAIKKNARAILSKGINSSQ